MSDLDLHAIVTEHAPFVWRVLRHLGVAEDQLDDLSQEVFMLLVERPDLFQARSSWRTFLYGVCRNIARSARRQRSVFRQGSAQQETEIDELPELAHEATQESAFWLKQDRERLIEIIAELNEEQRLIFVLYEIEEVSMEEIASSLAAPLRTCYSRLEAARGKVLSSYRRKLLCARPVALEGLK